MPRGSSMQVHLLDSVAYPSRAEVNPVGKIQLGHAYRCFCSPDKLAMTREKLARMGSNATYDKSCSNLTDEEVSRRVKAGEKHIIRMKVTPGPPLFST
jgi:glutamyl/glutaminyl-tRNA synthetase